MASLQGRIIETYTGSGVQGALISMGGATALTDANGYFTIQIPPGSWTLQVMHRSFQAYASAMVISQNMAYSLPSPIRLMSTVRAL